MGFDSLIVAMSALLALPQQLEHVQHVVNRIDTCTTIESLKTIYNDEFSSDFGICSFNVIEESLVNSKYANIDLYSYAKSHVKHMLTSKQTSCRIGLQGIEQADRHVIAKRLCRYLMNQFNGIHCLFKDNQLIVVNERRY